MGERGLSYEETERRTAQLDDAAGERTLPAVASPITKPVYDYAAWEPGKPCPRKAVPNTDREVDREARVVERAECATRRAAGTHKAGCKWCARPFVQAAGGALALENAERRAAGRGAEIVAPATAPEPLVPWTPEASKARLATQDDNEKYSTPPRCEAHGEPGCIDCETAEISRMQRELGEDDDGNRLPEEPCPRCSTEYTRVYHGDGQCDRPARPVVEDLLAASARIGEGACENVVRGARCFSREDARLAKHKGVGPKRKGLPAYDARRLCRNCLALWHVELAVLALQQRPAPPVAPLQATDEARARADAARAKINAARKRE